MTSIRPVWLLVPILNTVQQVCLKQSANAANESAGHFFHGLFISHWFALAIVAELVCFAIWTTVLRELDLSRAFPLSAVSYVFVMATAWFAFAEPLPLLQITGSLFILAGTWCLAGGSHT